MSNSGVQKESEGRFPVDEREEMKVNDNDSKDSYYVSPSSGHKIDSSGSEIKCTNSTQKRKSPYRNSKKKIIIEKTEAEGLPPGWIKEVKIKRRGRAFRRDPYYTDPVSGYVFRSMKDAVRYLETGELGRLAVKRKDTSTSHVDLDDKVSSPSLSETQVLASSETNTKIIEGHLTSNGKSCNDRVCETASEYKLQSAHNDDKCINISEPRNHNQPEPFNSSLTNETPVLAPSVAVITETKSSDDGTVKSEVRKFQLGPRKSKSKKWSNLPRRCSKRLAKLKTASKLSGDPEASTAILFDQLEANENQISAGDNVIKKEATNTEENNGNVETDNKAFGDPRFPLVSAFADSWSDPCIEFAVKTLTGVIPVEKILDIPNLFGQKLSSTQGNENLLELNSISENARKTQSKEWPNLPCRCSTRLAELKAASKQPGDAEASTAELFDQLEANENHIPAGDKVIKKEATNPEEKGGNVETDNKAFGDPNSPLVLPFGDSWSDPCFEFAVKTLTGAIPLEKILDIPNLFGQKLSSPQGIDNLPEPNSISDNACKTQTQAAPSPRVNGSLQNSGKTL